MTTSINNSIPSTPIIAPQSGDMKGRANTAFGKIMGDFQNALFTSEMKKFNAQMKVKALTGKVKALREQGEKEEVISQLMNELFEQKSIIRKSDFDITMAECKQRSFVECLSSLVVVEKDPKKKAIAVIVVTVDDNTKAALEHPQ